MDTNQILTLTVFVVVITIVGTIALAAVGYFAFRLRERRDPTRPTLDETMTRPYFFERVRLPAHDGEADEPEAPALAGGEKPRLEVGG
ncbi:MAG: hypothetical protein P8177_12585 [Gemmatimonadota bacterium]|jgi:hypothetical protein